MQRTSPTVSLSVTYLIPCFSLLWGLLFLGETISPLQCAGFVVVLLALNLVARR
jgi:drug/metabolite transporter (DMT)-like permease